MTPAAASASSAAASAAWFSFAVGGGIWSCTRSAAASSRMPVASPAASRSMRPDGGSGVAAVIPASARPLLLSSVECPSLEETRIGRSVASASSVALVASVPAGTIAWRYQLTTCSQASGPAPASASRQAWMRAWNCSVVSAAYSRLQVTSCSPPGSTWMWASFSPGMTVRPRRSRTVVRLPMKRRAPARSPA